MDRAAVRDRAADLPAEPGVYQFLAHGDATATDDQVDGERVLYVGKAVDLRERVRSYADPRGERIRQMVARATAIDYAVTDTETQALLLEANLIKRHQPRYNVRLKDDKSYPLVQLTDHQVPRIEITRDPDPGATVYGPYTDMGRLETVVKAVRETYGLRGCSDHKFAGRERPCLDYDIGLCSGPCVEETDVDSETYLADAETVERFFEGETGIVADPLRREMESAAADQHFERAANLRDRLDAVEALHAEGDAAIDSGDRRDHPAGERVVDVLGAAVEGERATVARLHSEAGKLVERDRHTLDGPDGESAGDVLAAFVTQFYADRDLPEAVVCSHHLTGDVESWLRGEGVAVRVPGGGREATLVDLALKNARSRDRTRDEGDLLAAALDLPGLDAIERIEGFDVSHAQGKATVGSDVTFVDGQPEKAHYRRKKLPDGNDDYASMRRLLAWRAQRAVEGRDDRPAPDLLLIDGGRGQLEAAREALAAEGWDVPAISLAKDEEVVVTPDGTYDWDDDAPQLHLLQRVRDEAHRFARQYHQSLRDEVSTVLDEVPGVGPETRKRLLGRFGSVGNVRDASVAELTDVEGVGEGTARKLDERL